MGSRTSPIPVQVGSGIPNKIRDYVYCLPFNDFDAFERCVKDHYGELAAVLVEPCLGNIAGIEPDEGFLDHIKALCDKYNIVLIFDECTSGFRETFGGIHKKFDVDINTRGVSVYVGDKN